MSHKFSIKFQHIKHLCVALTASHGTAVFHLQVVQTISNQHCRTRQALVIKSVNTLKMFTTCLRSNANIQTERRLLVLITLYGVIITLLHIVNLQTIFLIQPKTLQFIQKNSVYYGSRCYGCDFLIQNGYEKKNLAEVQLLIAVPSAVDHFEQRIWIRETWGQKEPSLFKKKAIYFFLGKSNNATLNEAVRKENMKYHDIVQAGNIQNCLILKQSQHFLVSYSRIQRNI